MISKGDDKLRMPGRFINVRKYGTLTTTRMVAAAMAIVRPA
jgi:hypothetical protein